ncbi:MAG: phage Gp37/Gp68 family protein [Planctomycetes bacterium]|nr:phage Gp37/Gp68 family protein [Planctomycetota bacterium]
MAIGSAIEWTESTWNPVTGCTKVSPGCAHCYAERFAKRLQAMGQRNYARGFELTVHEHVVELPLRWRRPQRIFVNSMSDLFHEEVPLSFIERVFDVMRRASWHVFQVLTKRAARMRELSERLDWPANVWAGVSVETERYLFRLDELRAVPAAVRFVSFEPLLGPVDRPDLNGIDWVIVGGESGPGARPIREEWVLSLRDQCLAEGIPFFFKQWGGRNKRRSGRLLEGRTWDEIPLFPVGAS